MARDLVVDPAPDTHLIDARRAMATLDHAEMNALARAYERWALTEVNVSPEQRTMLLQWSSDYEHIAEHCGTSWIASSPEYPPDAVVFLARVEVKDALNREQGISAYE